VDSEGDDAAVDGEGDDAAEDSEGDDAAVDGEGDGMMDVDLLTVDPAAAGSDED
jgi:hypothetical protein